MDIEKLDKKWLLKCPKDLFGELDPYNKETLEKIAREPAEKIKNLSDYMRGFLNMMTQWGFDAIDNNTYNQKLPYATKLRIAIVQRDEEEKFFLLQDTEGYQLLFTRITAIPFEGYLRNDKFSIKRGLEDVFSGSINYYGTHAACEVFNGNGRRAYKLMAQEFEVGDEFTIETVSYASTEKFAQYLINMKSMFGHFINEPSV